MGITGLSDGSVCGVQRSVHGTGNGAASSGNDGNNSHYGRRGVDRRADGPSCDQPLERSTSSPVDCIAFDFFIVRRPVSGNNARKSKASRGSGTSDGTQLRAGYALVFVLIAMWSFHYRSLTRD